MYAAGGPPSYRAYAKLVLMPDGTKRYVATDQRDSAAYEAAESALSERTNAYPVVRIQDGHNTRQVIRYGFTHWHRFFNARQLLALSILADGVRSLEPGPSRDLLAVLFSGTLEFNNMFASYKGEGTGAVRHLFSHHILKPERMPIEANLWGTPKSSGSFSGLFRSRLMRALDYAADPFDLVVVPELLPLGPPRTARIHGLSEPIGHVNAHSWHDFDCEHRRLYVSCGDSRSTDLPDRSVDIVVTDPPFFDNVHYSELADFFYVWQRYVDGKVADLLATTRSSAEVQHTDPAEFARRLGSVFAETCRVLKDDGLLVFTYHHSRAEGWISLVSALIKGGYVAVNTFPVKSEMAVATPKAQARQPIDIDLVIVCRKRAAALAAKDTPAIGSLRQRAADQISRMRAAGHPMGPGDVRVVCLGALLPLLTRLSDSEAQVLLERTSAELELTGVEGAA